MQQVENRETLQPVHRINRIFFGLYVGSKGRCTLTQIYRRDVSRCFEATSTEKYLLLPSVRGEKYVLEMESSTLREKVYDDDESESKWW